MKNTLTGAHKLRDTHRDTQTGKLTGTHRLRDIHIQLEKHTFLRANKQKTLRIRHTHIERENTLRQTHTFRESKPTERNTQRHVN